jgi:hypothetical protein
VTQTRQSRAILARRCARRAGWPWRSPTRAPTDPYVLILEHTVSQPTVRRSRRVPVAIRPSSVDIRENLDVFSMCPSVKPTGRRFASLHRAFRGEFPCYIGTIKALRLPAAHPAALRLAVPPRPLALFTLRRTSALPRPRVVIPVSPAGSSQRKRQDLPGSWGNPSVRLPCSVDAGRTARTRPLRCSSAAPGDRTAKAPTKGLSTLNSMAFGRAVYASQCGLTTPRATLASSRWSDTTGRPFHPKGSDDRFQSVNYISSSSPKLAWRNRSDHSA